MKKYRKVWCLVFMAAMLMGTSGCALLLQNLAPKHEEVEPGLEVGWPDDSKTEQDNNASETKEPEQNPEGSKDVADSKKDVLFRAKNKVGLPEYKQYHFLLYGIVLLLSKALLLPQVHTG